MNFKFSNIHHLSQRFALTHTKEILFIKKWNCQAILHIFGKRKLKWYWNTFKFPPGKKTSESRRCCNVNTRSESRRQKDNVVTTLDFGCGNDVRNTTLWQRYPTLRPKYNQNQTLLQSCVPTGFVLEGEDLTFSFKKILLLEHLFAFKNSFWPISCRRHWKEKFSIFLIRMVLLMRFA